MRVGWYDLLGVPFDSKMTYESTFSLFLEQRLKGLLS